MGALLRNLLNLVTLPLQLLLAGAGKLWSGPRRLARISLPAKVALAAFVFLLACVAATLAAFVFSTPDRAGIWAKLTPTFIAVVTLLIVLIPVVLYKVLQLWLEGEVIEFPDIDRAWKAGLAELEKRGLDLRQTPLFLVLGSPSAAQRKALFEASKLEFSFRDFPEGAAPLHWYACPDGVYVVLSEVGLLARVANPAEVAGSVRPLPVSPAGVLPPAQRRPNISPDPTKRTIEIGGDVLDSPLLSADAASAAAVEPANIFESPAGGKTVEVTDEIRNKVLAAAAQVTRNPSFPGPRIGLYSEFAGEDQRRLEFLGRLICRARRPVCPINGVLTLLPAGLIQRSDEDAEDLQRAVKQDLDVLVGGLRVRCVVRALVTGLEDESGFRELIRRVGRQRAANDRIGKRFDPWNQPYSDSLKVVAQHACGHIEDLVYSLFREPGSLCNPGNAKLYLLLCKVRRNILPRLEKILAKGYGFDPAHGQAADVLFFGGCYFAALGEDAKRQGFAKGVLDRLPEQQGYLAWTPSALAADDRYRLSGQFALAIDTLLVCGIAAILVYHYWWGISK